MNRTTLVICTKVKLSMIYLTSEMRQGVCRGNVAKFQTPENQENMLPRNVVAICLLKCLFLFTVTQASVRGTNLFSPKKILEFSFFPAKHHRPHTPASTLDALQKLKWNVHPPPPPCLDV